MFSRNEVHHPIRAERFVRKLRGTSQAHELLANDGYLYAVKFSSNPNGMRSLVSEFIGGAIYALMNVPSVQILPIEVGNDFIRSNPEVNILAKGSVMPPLPGIHLASRNPVHPDHRGEVAIFDFVPLPILSSFDRCAVFWRAFVLDVWLGRSEPRQALFLSRKAHRGEREVVVVDHRSVFSGHLWRFSRESLACWWPRREAYAALHSIETLAPIMDRVRSIDEEKVRAITCAIPPEWISSDGAELQRLIDGLLARRAVLPTLLIEALKRIGAADAPLQYREGGAV